MLPVSKSYTLMLTIAPPGRMTGVCMAAQLYIARRSSLASALQSVSAYTVVPKHAHPSEKHASSPGAHSEQLGAVAHDITVVTRRLTAWLHAKLT